MQKVTLTIGHKVGSVEILTTTEICAAVTTTLAVDAFTAIPCVGMWRGVPENSTRVEIVTDELRADEIVTRVPELAWQLNQEAIMCECSTANVTFPAAALVPAA